VATKAHIQVSVDPDALAALKGEAQRHGATISSFVRALLDERYRGVPGPGSFSPSKPAPAQSAAA
jgi:hypothetical protein